MNDELLRIIKKFKSKDRSIPTKKLPQIFFFTDRKAIKDIFFTISNLPKNSAVIIREYDLNYKKRLEFAYKIVDIAKKKSLKIFVGKDWKLAVKIKADGIHFSDRIKSKDHFKILNKNLNKKFLLSCSCHNPRSIKVAEQYNCDLIFYSPIFLTKSHIGHNPIGVLKLRNLILKTSTPIYALGGINHKNIKMLCNTYINGIGGISIFNLNPCLPHFV